MPESAPAPARFAKYRLEFEIHAPRPIVWRALVDETPRWWLPEFRMVEGSAGLTIEPFPGGRVYEEGPEGRGLLWFHVLEISPPRGLLLAGDLSLRYGGPARSQIEFDLVDEGERTILLLTDALVGAVSDDLLAALEDGWRTLMQAGLKPHAEDLADA